MLRRYLLLTLPLAFIFWTLFALFYFGYCSWMDVASMWVSQPCYLLEELLSPRILKALPALGLHQDTLSHVVLITGFILWASFLMMPLWFPSAIERRRRRLWMLACWPLAALTLLASLAFSVHDVLRHMH